MRSLFLVALGFGAMTARSDRQDPLAPAAPMPDRAIAPDTGSVLDALFAPAPDAAPRRVSGRLRLDGSAPQSRR